MKKILSALLAAAMLVSFAWAYPTREPDIPFGSFDMTLSNDKGLLNMSESSINAVTDTIILSLTKKAVTWNDIFLADEITNGFTKTRLKAPLTIIPYKNHQVVENSVLKLYLKRSGEMIEISPNGNLSDEEPYYLYITADGYESYPMTVQVLFPEQETVLAPTKVYSLKIPCSEQQPGTKVQVYVKDTDTVLTTVTLDSRTLKLGEVEISIGEYRPDEVGYRYLN